MAGACAVTVSSSSSDLVGAASAPPSVMISSCELRTLSGVLSCSTRMERHVLVVGRKKRVRQEQRRVLAARRTHALEKRGHTKAGLTSGACH